jgi:aminoglycoside phosphotransferase (APT) family kinase protein
VTEAGTTRLRVALAAAGVAWDQVAASQRMAGGTFNAVYLVTLADGARLVVKIAPESGTPLLRYERGILGTEALFYRLASECTGVSVPEVLAVEAGDGTGGYLVMTECPGMPWPSLVPQPADGERDALRAELGGMVARLHEITGAEFGYPTGAVGPLRPTWRAAFLDMVDAVLADAQRFSVTLPRPNAEIRALFESKAAVLDEVTRPVLTHFDLWDGNVLVESGPHGLRVGALIDAERAFWGDPLADFISLALFGDVEGDAAFLRGYREAGGSVTFDAASRLRLSLYQAYLYLIMWIEVTPRQYGEERLEWLRGRVWDPLAAALTDWSAR